MLEFRWIKGSENIEPIIKLRHDVFCKEQGYPYMLEKDDLESKSYHLGVYSDGKLIGCGRLAPESADSFHLGRIALYPEYRGGGNGAKLVNEILRKAKELGAKYVTIEAQTHAIGFYKKLGFIPDGSLLYHEQIPHIPMIKSFVFDNAKLCECNSDAGAVFVRREFTTENKKIVNAKLEYTTLGFSVPYFNGHKLTEYKFIPAWSNYKNRDMTTAIYPLFDEMRERVYYLEYDITDYINNNNAFVLHIGNGWYRQLDQAIEGLSAYGDKLKYIYKITLVYDDGSVCEICSDSTEDVYDSFITHSSIYINETVDGRLYNKNILNFGYKSANKKSPALSDEPTFALTK
ncbi:MAG: GNAT family N-acetyltransferase, partial [Oscillospiraceae bacterium]|nr:GNAT family N-acetyltransferase [Oscillospiraceae bacterium]